ncbi:MAG TPA: tetratricopeptide repeat protein [Bacteroidales bacterium]|nr:tetratricopeptide repeat protein [Bacteroidales bacterium]
MKNIIVLVILIFSMSRADGQTPDLVLLKVEAFISNGKYSEAVNECTNALKMIPDYRLYLKRGEAYLEAGDITMAKNDFLSANSLERASGDLGLAQVAARSGNSKQAVDLLEKHMKSDFKIREKDLMLDKYLAAIEDSYEWKNFLKKSWYTELEQGVSEIEYLLREGKIDEATETFSYLSSVYNEKPEVDYLAGLIDLQKGNFEGAVNKLCISVSEGYTTYNAWISYIIALHGNQSYSTSFEVIKEAIINFPDNAELYIYLAEAKRRSGDRNGALKELQFYLELYPDNQDVIDLAGKVAYERKNYSEALKYYSLNIEKDPGNADHYNARANVYLVTRSWEFALSDYSMALDLDPYNADTYYNKGLSMVEKGEIEGACHDFRQSLRLGNKKASSMINRYCIK